MATANQPLTLDLDSLRNAIREEYELVALEPEHGFHFHTGRSLAHLIGYPEEWLVDLPESCIESFAGTGNPFSIRALNPGERVVDVGSGAGFDSLIAARMVSPVGQVMGIDMTPAMIEKARSAASKKPEALLRKPESATWNSATDTPRHYQLRMDGLML